MQDAGMPRLIRKRLDSSSLASATYDPSSGTLEVQLRKTGHFYRYLDVPEEAFRAFMQAESKGAFLNEEIAPYFEYVRVDIPL